MKSYELAFACILFVVLIGGCTGATTTPTIDPLTGSWTCDSNYNNSTITSTLVFSQEGNFNGYLIGLLSLSGHWTKINATAYNVIYGNKTELFMMSTDKTQIWDNVAPSQIFTKQ